MKQHITRHWGRFRQLPQVTQYAWMVLVLLLLVWIAVKVTPVANTQVSEAHDEHGSGALLLATQTVGSETASFATASSWPGEIISQSDAEVQAPREGSIVSWDVAIGQ